jgi:ABC-type uncharacterized transport system permease subunit
MTILIRSLNLLLPFLYLVTVWFYAVAFFRKSAWASRGKTALLLGAVLVHACYIAFRTVAFAHPPITTIFEIMTIIAFTMAVAYAVIERQTRISSTGFFILLLPLVFQAVSTMLIVDLTDVKPVLRSNLLGFHVLSALLGYSAFAVSAVYGFLYIMLYNNIKTNRFGVIYENLPNLETLERMAIVSVFTGFILLTIAIGVGVVWLPRAFAEFSYFDPKLIGTALVWLMYGVGLISKRLGSWQGRKIMMLSIVGFAVSLFSMTVINVWFSHFHSFH